MTRFHATATGPVAFTGPEESAKDAEEAAIVAAAPAIAANTARKQAIEATIAADTDIQALRSMTNAEFDTWWSANVTNLAQANAILKRVTRVVLRRVVNGS